MRSAIATIAMGMAIVACSTGDREPDLPTEAPLQATPPAVLTPPASAEPSAPSVDAPATPRNDEPDVPQEAPLVAYPEISIASLDSFTGNFVVGGYVTGIVEIGGDCTFIVKNKATGAEVKATSTGIDNSDATSCGSVDIPGNKIPDGEYSVVLEYSNGTGSAASSPLAVVVSR